MLNWDGAGRCSMPAGGGELTMVHDDPTNFKHRFVSLVY